MSPLRVGNRQVNPSAMAVSMISQQQLDKRVGRHRERRMRPCRLTSRTLSPWLRGGGSETQQQQCRFLRAAAQNTQITQSGTHVYQTMQQPGKQLAAGIAIVAVVAKRPHDHVTGHTLSLQNPTLLLHRKIREPLEIHPGISLELRRFVSQPPHACHCRRG